MKTYNVRWAIINPSMLNSDCSVLPNTFLGTSVGSTTQNRVEGTVYHGSAVRASLFQYSYVRSSGHAEQHQDHLDE